MIQKKNKDKSRSLLALSIATIGIVFGDIGTSPLYAVKECFNPAFGITLQTNSILGVMSLIFWTIIMIIVVKYLTVVVNADNQGEGGIMSLLAILLTSGDKKKINLKATVIFILLGMFGSALLLSDGMITPAISVLSAIEGLKIATPIFKDYIIYISAAILILLFLVQRRGTEKIGKIFGPLTILWFLTIGILGFIGITKDPLVLTAINPYYVFWFFMHYKLQGILILGAVVLCVTGGEALYADIGHFGKKPILVSWYFLVLPCLLLNYFGQSSILMIDKTTISNPFYSLAPGWFLLPLVAISTMATIIASQALISGCFSLTQQAVQLGYLPRLNIMHTSDAIHGQIYVPAINNFLMIACVILVLTFKTSSNLASAYGIAVMGTMTITTILIFFVQRTVWNWRLWKALLVSGVFLVIDISFLSGNVVKIFHGGWVPILISLVVFYIMSTWKKISEELQKKIRRSMLPVKIFIEQLKTNDIHRVNGVSVFLTANPFVIPRILLHHVKHDKVLHEKVILLSIVVERVPFANKKNRLTIKSYGFGFYQALAHYGYMEQPNIPEALRRAKGLDVTPESISYYLGHVTLINSGKIKIANWRRNLYIFLSRNSREAKSYFGIPTGRVTELGLQDEI